MSSQLSVLAFALLGAVGVEGHARWKCPAPRDENDASGTSLFGVGWRGWDGHACVMRGALRGVPPARGGSGGGRDIPDSLPGCLGRAALGSFLLVETQADFGCGGHL